MAQAFVKCAVKVYDHLSAPLYDVNGEGPYFIILFTDKTPWKVCFYEFVDEESFLANPGSSSILLANGLSLYEALSSTDLPIDEILQNELKLSLRKIIPATPACRKVFSRLMFSEPDIAEGIICLTDLCVILSQWAAERDQLAAFLQ